MTLYDATLKLLIEHNKKLDDIEWIGCKEFCISTEEFIECSKRISDKTKDVLSKNTF